MLEKIEKLLKNKPIKLPIKKLSDGTLLTVDATIHGVYKAKLVLGKPFLLVYVSYCPDITELDQKVYSIIEYQSGLKTQYRQVGKTYKTLASVKKQNHEAYFKQQFSMRPTSVPKNVTNVDEYLCYLVQYFLAKNSPVNTIPDKIMELMTNDNIGDEPIRMEDMF